MKSVIRYLFLLLPTDKFSAACILGIRFAIAACLFGWSLNLMVMAANDFKMPVIVDGEEISELDVGEKECLYSGKNSYLPFSYSAPYAEKHVHLWFLADWVRVEQPVDLSFLPRPLRFVARGMLCLPEGIVIVSPGDIIMWGSVVLCFFSIALFGMRRGVIRLRALRDSRSP